jgi:hypothetical protein
MNAVGRQAEGQGSRSADVGCPVDVAPPGPAKKRDQRRRDVALGHSINRQALGEDGLTLRLARDDPRRPNQRPFEGRSG